MGAAGRHCDCGGDMSLTPDKLRAYAKQFEIAPYAPIAAKDCDMLADAMEIADSSARAHIECCCKTIGGNAKDGLQWDTSTADKEDAATIAQELRYLQRRGLIVRHWAADHIISFKAAE